MSNEAIFPMISISITTFEFYDGKWNATVTHTFYGDTEEDARKVMAAHRMTDSLFDASFSGNFKGIVLSNSKEIVHTKADLYRTNII